MPAFKKTVEKISQTLDIIAGWCLVAAVALIVGNIILRELFSSPFIGTYEFVGYIVSIVIAFSLAYCASKDGHIAVGFILDRFPEGVRKVINTVIHALSFLFLSLLTWSVARHASRMAISGEVSSTTEIPYYPFIFLVSFGLLVLTLILFIKLIASIKGDA